MAKQRNHNTLDGSPSASPTNVHSGCIDDPPILLIIDESDEATNCSGHRSPTRTRGTYTHAPTHTHPTPTPTPSDNYSWLRSSRCLAAYCTATVAKALPQGNNGAERVSDAGPGGVVGRADDERHALLMPPPSLCIAASENLNQKYLFWLCWCSLALLCFQKRFPRPYS